MTHNVNFTEIDKTTIDALKRHIQPIFKPLTESFSDIETLVLLPEVTEKNIERVISKWNDLWLTQEDSNLFNEWLNLSLEYSTLITQKNRFLQKKKFFDIKPLEVCANKLASATLSLIRVFHQNRQLSSLASIYSRDSKTSGPTFGSDISYVFRQFLQLSKNNFYDAIDNSFSKKSSKNLSDIPRLLELTRKEEFLMNQSQELAKSYSSLTATLSRRLLKKKHLEMDISKVRSMISKDSLVSTKTYTDTVASMASLHEKRMDKINNKIASLLEKLEDDHEDYSEKNKENQHTIHSLHDRIDVAIQSYDKEMNRHSKKLRSTKILLAAETETYNNMKQKIEELIKNRNEYQIQIEEWEEKRAIEIKENNAATMIQKHFRGLLDRKFAKKLDKQRKRRPFEWKKFNPNKFLK